VGRSQTSEVSKVEEVTVLYVCEQNVETVGDGQKGVERTDAEVF
jgi:hypothetical protein